MYVHVRLAHKTSERASLLDRFNHNSTSPKSSDIAETAGVCNPLGTVRVRGEVRGGVRGDITGGEVNDVIYRTVTWRTSIRFGV